MVVFEQLLIFLGIFSSCWGMKKPRFQDFDPFFLLSETFQLNLILFCQLLKKYLKKNISG